MKEIIQVIFKNRPLLLVLLGIVYLLYAFFIIFTVESSAALSILFLGILIIFYEILLRLVLRFVYGKNYRYALYNYFIVDHKLYGNSFRKNITTQDINFPVFDKFVFKQRIIPSLDLDENKRDRVAYSINSLGFRGREFSPEKKSKIRIFCSGGSTTACNSVNDNETWPSALEEHLKKNNYDVEVINAGLQGWSSYQELLRLKNEIVNYNPDIILLHQGWNEEFAYSSQNLGRWWHPHTLRNMIETRYLYSGRHPILSSTRSILFFYLMQLYFRDYIFTKNMRFSNPKRWECLKQKEYTMSWFDNLTEFAHEARKNNIQLYTVNYPGLCNLEDSLDEREIYIRGTRLTPLYADYQAVSKKQIQRTLYKMNSIISCIDAEKQMDNIREEDRLKLFIDEVHLSPEGNTVLGKLVAEQLVKDKNFQTLAKGERAQGNLVFDEKEIAEIKSDIGKNYNYVDEFIDATIEKAKRGGHKKDAMDLPTERYTTF